MRNPRDMGATTLMVLDACKKFIEGENVIIVAHEHNYARDLLHQCYKVLEFLGAHMYVNPNSSSIRSDVTGNFLFTTSVKNIRIDRYRGIGKFDILIDEEVEFRIDCMGAHHLRELKDYVGK